MFEVSTILKNKKLKRSNILIENYRDMLENLDIEQENWSKTSHGVYEVRHGSNSLMKWLA